MTLPPTVQRRRVAPCSSVASIPPLYRARGLRAGATLAVPGGFARKERLMRTIWNGSISFGLVNVPIGLALATQRSDVAFRTLHSECGTPIKTGRYCPQHERNVESDELVKGWEVAKGVFVVVEDAELEGIALRRSQSIDVLRFVKLEDVDPVYFDKTYYLAPAAAQVARRPYVLLLRAMQETGMAAIGKSVLWGKENLCLIRPHGDALAVETLFFGEDIRSRAEIQEAVSEVDEMISAPELELAKSLIGSLVGEFDPSEFENEYRNDLKAMLAAKVAGEQLVRPEVVPEAPIVDLMEALRRSVADAAARANKAPVPSARKAKKQRVPARTKGGGERG